MIADDFLHGGLVEDEDGAPYPEHVQIIIRTLALEKQEAEDSVQCRLQLHS